MIFFWLQHRWRYSAPWDGLGFSMRFLLTIAVIETCWKQTKKLCCKLGWQFWERYQTIFFLSILFLLFHLSLQIQMLLTIKPWPISSHYDIAALASETSSPQLNLAEPIPFSFDAYAEKPSEHPVVKFGDILRDPSERASSILARLFAQFPIPKLSQFDLLWTIKLAQSFSTPARPLCLRIRLLAISASGNFQADFFFT